MHAVIGPVEIHQDLARLRLPAGRTVRDHDALAVRRNFQRG
jgi:hypothetical protein